MKSEQVKKDFLSNISHELWTPWQGLEVIAHETNRLIGLVEELLDFSRLQSGRVTLNLRLVDVGRLADEVMRQFAARAREGGLELRAEVPADVPAEALGCVADEGRLRQVLINLVDNAVKFTGPGGLVRVSVRPGMDANLPSASRARGSAPTAAGGPTAADELAGAGSLTITVSDSGCGISPDDLPRVTGEFCKADSKKPGSGLGLSIVDEIVRLHGGQVRIDSEPGRGTTVAVWLPVGPHAEPRPDDLPNGGLALSCALAPALGPAFSPTIGRAPDSDEHGVTVSMAAQPLQPLVLSPRLGLQRGDAVLNALVVDAGDGRDVVLGGAAEVHWSHSWRQGQPDLTTSTGVYLFNELINALFGRPEVAEHVLQAFNGMNCLPFGELVDGQAVPKVVRDQGYLSSQRPPGLGPAFGCRRSNSRSRASICAARLRRGPCPRLQPA